MSSLINNTNIMSSLISNLPDKIQDINLNIEEKARTTDPVTNSLSENKKPLPENISGKRKSAGRYQQKAAGSTKQEVATNEKQRKTNTPEGQNTNLEDKPKSGVAKKRSKASEKKSASTSTKTSADNNEKTEKRTGWWNKVLN